jgi:hypothetical protein
LDRSDIIGEKENLQYYMFAVYFGVELGAILMDEVAKNIELLAKIGLLILL